MPGSLLDGPRLPILIGLVSGLLACAVQTPPADPFSADSGSRPGSTRGYRVRLEALCEGCAITYSIAGRTTSVVSSSPIWRATLNRYPRFPETIQLAVSGAVDQIRIYVDGDVVASQEARGTGHAVLQVSTVVPPPADAPVPDTSRSVREGPSRRD